MSEHTAALSAAWRDLDVSVDDFWLMYFSLGGDRMPGNIEDLLAGEWEPSQWEYNLLAQALNEIHVDRGGDHPVPYWEDPAH